MRNPYKSLSAVLLAALTFILLSGQGGKKPEALIGRSLALVDAKGRVYATISEAGGEIAFELKHPSGAMLAATVSENDVRLILIAAKGETAVLNCSKKVGAALLLRDRADGAGMSAKSGGGTKLGIDAAGKVWQAVPK